MMRDMASDSLDQRLQRHRPRLGVNATPLEILRPEGSQNPGHLLTDQGDQQKLLVEVSLVIGKACGENRGVAAE